MIFNYEFTVGLIIYLLLCIFGGWLFIKLARLNSPYTEKKAREFEEYQKKKKAFKIICPECGKNIKGYVTQPLGFPYFSYYGYCKKCDYHITESEWKEKNEL